MSSQPPYDEIAERILKMGRIVATRIDSTRVAQFRLDIERQRIAVGDHKYYRDWLAIVDAGAESLARAFLDESERGRYLRAVAPMRAFVTQDERDTIFDRHIIPPELRRPEPEVIRVLRVLDRKEAYRR